MTEHQAILSILQRAKLDATDNRVRVVALLCNRHQAMTAPDMLKELRREHDMDKVTLYRILELLTKHHVVERHNGGDRSYRYCLAAEGQPPHGHFYCTQCGRMDCLVSTGTEQSFNATANVVDTTPLLNATRALPFDVQHIELRLDGVCETCRQAG